MSRFFRLALAAHFLAAFGTAAVYYVAPDGKDSNKGSPKAPFRTLGRGAQAARAGDTVIVRDGAYDHENAVTGGDGSDSNHSPVVLRTSGRPEAWITFRAENKWGATLDCEMKCDSYFNLVNSAYIVIQDFVITRGYREAIHSNDAAHHIAIRGNRIEYIANRPSTTRFGLSGVYTNPACHDFVFDGNVFHDIGRTDPSQLDHALYLHGENMTITNNVFYNIPHGWAIQTAEGLRHVLIGNNVFAFKNSIGKPGQIMLWDRQSDVTIRNNIFFGGEKYAITRYHSTITSCTIDHNIVYGPSRVIEDRDGCTVADNRVGSDPMFVNASHPPYDFHLRPGSPAAGAGPLPPY